ncbi:MAG: porin family protein [Bacteroidales bacterium]|nr:porin family protein [Bacteroidales bacterium]
MRKVVVMFIFAMTAVMASAQQEKGTWSITPKVGAAVSSITNNVRANFLIAKGALPSIGNYLGSSTGTGVEIEGVGTNMKKAKLGLTIGADVMYQAASKLGLSAGVFYSTQGVNFKDCDFSMVKLSNASINLNCLSVPIMAHYYVAKGLALNAGLQLNFFLKKTLTGDLQFKSTTGNSSTEQYTRLDSQDEYCSLDFSIPVGASYEFNNLVFEVRYNWGITNIMKSKDFVGGPAPNYKNSSFHLTLGYKFKL